MILGEEPESTSEVDDACFIRTEDIVCLMCTNGESLRHGYLAAEGFGSQMCHLEPEPRNQEPCELHKSMFKLEDAMSVHAMYTNGSSNKSSGNCKILMYGHAILLRHLGTKKLLCSLSSSPENDKMAYDVGFDQQHQSATDIDERCWFRVIPGSNQRSEGEKVRAGDEIFLVNVSNARYLSAEMSSFQTAESELSDSRERTSLRVSFHQCMWSLHIVCSGSAKEEAIGNVNGGDVVRFIHRYWGGDVLMVKSPTKSRNLTNLIPDSFHCDVQYEKSTDNNYELRSLWRVELFQMKFGGGFTSWGQPFRLCHLITGKFLGIKHEGKESERLVLGEGASESLKNSNSKTLVALLNPSEASRNATAFCFVKSAAKRQWTKSHLSSMGIPEIQFGDSEVYLYHIHSGKYLGCDTSERRHKRVSHDVWRATMKQEFNQSFAFTMTRASQEQAKAASIVQLSESIKRNYVQKVLVSKDPTSANHLEKNLANILTALIYYFKPPDKQILTYEQYQQQLCCLRERQNLFKKQGMLTFTLTVIIETARNIKGDQNKVKILHSLYQLLAAMIRGNRDNCREFATQSCLKVFMRQLSLPEVTHYVLVVIQCLLTDSPEVLNIFSSADIGIIVNLLNTNGRDNEVMKLLSSLCVCHGVAMRDKQKLIYKHLLNCSDLLVQTSLHPRVHSVHPDLHIGSKTGSATYKKWYYEVQIMQFQISSPSSSSCLTPYFRAGWAHATNFRPHPCSNGIHTLDGGIGDDVFSMGFDGASLWMGGHQIKSDITTTTTTTTLTIPSNKYLTRQEEVVTSPVSEMSCDMPLAVGDVIGCCIDLEKEVAWFTKNGRSINNLLKLHGCNDLVTPAISFSSGVSAVISLGGNLGSFSHTPPAQYAGLYEAIEPGKAVTLLAFQSLGDVDNILVSGPPTLSDFESFVPAPIDTSKAMLPDSITSARGSVRDMLAKNIHEVWGKNKIEQGYSYGEVRNDERKLNPSLKAFEDLTDTERAYDYDMALKTLSTLVSLGYQISAEDQDHSLVKYQDLPPEIYKQSNGYIPRPLDLSIAVVPSILEDLVDKLAENAHNIWAVSRISQGWTYGKSNDSNSKRNAMLIPYSKLDDAGKKSNYDTAYESLRTVCGLGCTVTPPASGCGNINELMREFSELGTKYRTFRGQKCYKVTQGKWYYEVNLFTGGMMRIGWAKPCFEAGRLLGSDDYSYAFDGHLSRKWHSESESFGRRWSAGDVIGCLLDIDEKTISFSLNGELLYDSQESTITFENVDTSRGFVPAITLSSGEKAQINFGHSSEELKYFTYFERSGYIPLCSPVALQYNIPLWYSAHGGYKMMEDESKYITRKTDTWISVECKDWDYSLQSEQECIRLNVGFIVGSSPSLTLVPRPGLLSPMPVTEDSNLTSPDNVIRKLPDKPISFTVEFPSGQVLSSTAVGWTTPSFRYVESHYGDGSHENQCCSSDFLYGQRVEVDRGDNDGGERFDNAFMVSLCNFFPTKTPQLTAPASIYCTLDLTNGKMTFSCDATSEPYLDSTNESQNVITHTAYAGAKLFPTIMTTPSTKDVVKFDFTPIENCKPLISYFISDTSDRPKTPLCPLRFKLMLYSKSSWVRQSLQSPNYSTESAIDGRLKISTKDLDYDVLVTLPQEDKVMAILEISEDLVLMDFHIRTLEALCAVCSHSNLSLAKSVSQYLDSEQLLKCIQTNGMRYELRAAYLKLICYLHLSHRVQTKLLMRGEFILPISECTESVPIFMAASDQTKISKGPRRFRMTMAGALPGTALASSIRHGESTSFSQAALTKTIDFSLGDLKELVLYSLESLLHSNYYKMYLLPADTRSPIFVPMIEVVDALLVMGLLNHEKDLQRVLYLLDPQTFDLPANSTKEFEEGLLSQEVSNEEPMKLAICMLLQHLLDCQVCHKVKSVVCFSNSFVEKMQKEQEERHKKNLKKKPKEFRSSSEMQVQGMLANNPDHTCSKDLYKKLKCFTDELKCYCGVSLGCAREGHELSSWDKLKKLAKLITSVEYKHQHHDDSDGGDGVSNCNGEFFLKHIITDTMIKWASKDIQDLRLIEEIFSLLYRQFNGVNEVMEALKKTYVLEVVRDPKTNTPNYNIQAFCNALGSLRLLLKVGMSQKEENLLKNSLKTINHSNIFYCHPSLLQKLEVHSTVLTLMKTYLGTTSGSRRQNILVSKRNLALDCYGASGLPMPIEKCCRFLCKFAKLNQENQRALFKHIAYLLEHAEKYPGLLSCDGGYTPLDVATATIRDNRELALALEESHLEHVVQLLVAVTTSLKGPSSADSFNTESMIQNSASCSLEWNPESGEKCLEFLQSAVWVEDEQIQENAYIIVQHLIHHSECLGPALSGEALGLHTVYKKILKKMDVADKGFASNESVDDYQCQESAPNIFTMQRQESDIFLNCKTESILTFYTNLVRLLSYCASKPETAHRPNALLPKGGAHSANKQKQSVLSRTRNILQNLIRDEEIVAILSFKSAIGRESGLKPFHKEAALLFFDRVYGVPSPELLLQLLTDAFLPDLKLALQLFQDGSESTPFYSSLTRYVCCSVLPLLGRFSTVFKQLKSQNHIIKDFLMCCFRIFNTSNLSSAQLEEVASFFIAVLKELHPRTVQRFMPMIIASLTNMKPHTIVACKLLSSHYDYFSRYYQSSGLFKTSHGIPTEEEKTCSALTVYRLLDSLSGKVSADSSLMKSGVSCLKSIANAISPSCLVPCQANLNSLYQSSGVAYDPQPLDTSRATLTPELKDLVDKFSAFQHSSWVFSLQAEGWVYGPVHQEDRSQHPNLRPYEALCLRRKNELKKPVEEAISYLITKGWNLNKLRPIDFHSIPHKQKMVCVRKPFLKKKLHRVLTLDETYLMYEPEVPDLSKVDLKPELQALAEEMAEHSHDSKAKELISSDRNYQRNPYFIPYELADETKKDELRTFALDLLRYMQVAGFEPNRAMHHMAEQTLTEKDSYKKFSLEFFDKFLDFLSRPEMSVDFYIKILFPLFSSYLRKWGGYFMPSSSLQASSSTASKEEKVVILKLFCRIIEFTRKKLDLFFPSMKNPSAKILSPSSLEDPGEGSRIPDADNSWQASNSIRSLLQSLVQCMDIESIAGENGSVGVNCTEMADFFRLATSGIGLTVKNIAKMSALDSQFHFYCLHILIPSLTALFKHVGYLKVGHLLISGPIKEHCDYILTNLIEMATSTGPVYVGSSPLITVGQCLGMFSLAYPTPFLSENQFNFSLSSLLSQLENATKEGVTCGNVLFVVDIIIPVLSSYVTKWNDSFHQFGACHQNSADSPVKVDEILVNILMLMATHFGEKNVIWFNRVIESSVLLARICSREILGTHVVPIMEEMKVRAINLWDEENHFNNTWNVQTISPDDETRYSIQEMFTEVMEEKYRIYVRDLTTLLPFLSVFIHSKHEEFRHLCFGSQREETLCDHIQTLFISLSDIFNCWSSSQYFKREFQTCIHQFSQQMRDHLSLLKCVEYLGSTGAYKRAQVPSHSRNRSNKLPNFIMLCLELLLPLADMLISKEDRVLLELCTNKLGMKGVNAEDLKDEIINKLVVRDKSQKLTHKLVRRISFHLVPTPRNQNRGNVENAMRILSLAKVKHKVQQAEKGHVAQTRWRQLISQRKRKAVINCFLAVPFFKISKHRAMNMFLDVYCLEWLANMEHTSHYQLSEELIDHQDYLVRKRMRDNDMLPKHEQKKLPVYIDPLSQLFKMFKRIVSTGRLMNKSLYISYANVLCKSVVGQNEEDDVAAEENATGAYEVYTEQKAQLVVKQIQLADRGASSTILNIITESNGERTPILHSTLHLGIALLTEGNQKIQNEMLSELDSMDVGFLSSISKLISTCSVLDWNAYERFNKSESTHVEAMCKVLPDYNFSISLFHFLQLLCEGHNLSFQNYLRTQAGNTTTVNIIVCTVDYLLRLQESISDFYWHYSDYMTIDLSGRENFLKAFQVAKQVFRTLTEYIQGPCVKNQEALARSRLWDAVSGFIHVFAVLQRKLYKDTSQMELLRELLGLQEEMFILLLSMLEGSTMSSSIGKLMMDMLTESKHHIEDIMSFFSIFIKLNDSTTSTAFKEYDLNRDGFISYREFEKAMEAQQRYTKEDISFLMECADLNNDGLLDYLEFTERFHQPAENIGFHLCVLIVHLTDHLPNDKRVEKLKAAPQSRELLQHFEKNMGCIEILGKSGRIERVYFEVKDSRMSQWDEAQIMVSRRSFLHTVEMGSQKNKLKGFMSFCDETIFEMNYSEKISDSAHLIMEEKAVQHRRQHNRMLYHQSKPIISQMRARVNAFQKRHTLLRKLLLWFHYIWILILGAWPVPKPRNSAAWRKFSTIFSFIKNWLGPHPARPTNIITYEISSSSSNLPSKKKPRPPNLIIPNQQLKSSLRHRAQTTISKEEKRLGTGITMEQVTESKERTTDTSLLKIEKRRSDDVRRGSLQPSDLGNGARHVKSKETPMPSYTPRIFKSNNFNLSYDPSAMKNPNSTQPSPMNDNPSLKLASSESAYYIPQISRHTKNWPSFLARNYFRFNNTKLCVTAIINIILLSYQVTHNIPGMVILPDSSSVHFFESIWTPLFLHFFSLLHFLLSTVLIVSYFYLKIPLVIFKREKQIARKLEDHHLWVTPKPLRTWSEWWDQLVVGAYSFPRNYWDKRVKQRVYESFGGDERSSAARALGMEVKSKFEKRTVAEQIMETLHSLVDIRYSLWTVGVTLSNPESLYHLLYCALSFIGFRWNSFYFSIHLLDFVMHFKLLKTVLKSVLHNGKQLAMTVLMTCVVIYIYTVVAFNFFRKFYRVESPSGELVFKCDSMLECFIFHIDHGLRSGGGIADVLEPASGDPSESFRLFFDITFFFFVVVILLAIIQGLIIDAFGELRDKEETLNNEMLTKCFVCGLSKSEFDHVPHGFDNHVAREHNMAHYMFFLMYLIKKKESEFSGQESYVWEKYLQQSVDFFPVGDCFQSQEERTLAASQAAAEGRGFQNGPSLRKKSSQHPQKPVLKKAMTTYI